jgi:hypothetical protein
MQLAFDMPFDWNLSRIKNMKIYVHEEVSIPKLSALASKGGYSGTVNGIDVSKQMMLVNSDPKNEIVHVMLPKDRLVSIAEQMNKDGQASTDLMKFTLRPGSEMMIGSEMMNMNSMSDMLH